MDHPSAFLARYGYLAPGKPDAGDAVAGHDRTSLRLALREFQTTARIPVTGELDDATRTAMARPRCGFPDRDVAAPDPFAPATGSFVQFGTRWKRAILTYGFAEATPDLDADTQRRIIRSGFEQWAAVVPLVFREVPADQGPDIRIRFASGPHNANPDDGDPPFDGPGAELAHAFFPEPNGGDLAGDVHYDDAETWLDGLGDTGFDLLTVTVHELGHSLGLNHTAVPGSTMNPFYPTPLPPQPDDRAGMRDLYGEHIWVASIYRDLLGRRFDDDGLDFWVRHRFGGATERAVARGFCYSDEFSRAQVTGLFLTLLDRAPDAEGLAFWTDALRAGASLESVTAGFLESGEYLAANPVPDAFAASLYPRLLNRPPDQAGLANWVRRLAEGATPGAVALEFLRSEEFCRKVAVEQYTRFLRRPPDQPSLQGWVDELRAGLPRQDLITGFLASAEYRAATGQWW